MTIIKVCPKCESLNVEIASARWKGDCRWECRDCGFSGEIFPEREGGANE